MQFSTYGSIPFFPNTQYQMEYHRVEWRNGQKDLAKK